MIRLKYKNGKPYQGEVRRKVTLVYETDKNGNVLPKSQMVVAVFYTSASWAGRFGKSRFIKEIGTGKQT